MIISVAFRHMPHSNSLKEYLEKRVTKFTRLLKEPIEVKATISREKYRYDLNLKIKSQWFNFNVKETGDDWHTVIDNACSSIENMARRERERLKDRKKSTKISYIAPLILNENKSENEIKIKHRVLKLKPTNQNDAIEELKNEGNNLVVFWDAETHGIRVAHRKSQNVIEVIIPEMA